MLMRVKVKLFNIIASILINYKNFKEAIECLDLCIKLNPNYGYFFEKKG